MELLVKLIVWLIQLGVGIFFAMGSIYLAVRLLNKLTPGIDEEAELKKGNAAVGVMMLGVVIATALVVSSGVVGLTQAITGVSGVNIADYIIAIIFGLIQLGAGVGFAVVSIYLAFNIWDKITTTIDEKAELARGNVAIGIVMAGVIIAVALVIREGVSGLASAIGAAGPMLR
ncbi:MAG: DUF350 domain-containing protein [Chloroflexi bacterium]|nr:DUF350 domain-containing protein [Chloroflexota bacterium]